jgi:Tfp pilus assembly protein PilV
MIRRPCTTGGPRRGQRGFTLMTVLIAIFLFGFGLLAILRSIGSITGGATQNQNVATVATLSNGFWGVVQANPKMVVDSALGSGSEVTFTAANISSAPAALQPWLYMVTSTTPPAGVGGGVPPVGLPNGQVKIQTSADTSVSSGTACAVDSGCSIKLTLMWTQVGGNGAAASTRSQVFYYQFGL